MITPDNRYDKKGYNEHISDNPQNKEVQNDTLEWTEKKIENMFETIKTSLSQTTLMLLRIWVIHPEISKEMHELKDKFDKNKQTMSREFTSGVLWEVRELLNKYWNDREKSITKELWNVLFTLQQKRSEWNKTKSFNEVVKFIDNNIWKDVVNFIWDIDTIKWTENTSDSNSKRNQGLGPFIYQWPYVW